MRRRLARQLMKTCKLRSSLSVSTTITTIITAGVDMDRAWSWYRRDGTGITITIITTIITASIAIEIAPAMTRKTGPTEVLFFWPNPDAPFPWLRDADGGRCR